MRVARTAACLALACLCASLACGPRRDARPNVLLISLDSVRADYVGAYGARLPHAPGRSPTPNLDRVAARGVLYSDGLSTTSWTLPAHVTLFTGEPELVHAVEQDGQCIAADLPTLPEILHGQGYRTRGIYSGPDLDPRHGFGRGFEGYEAAYGPELAQATADMAALEQALGPEHTTAGVQDSVDRHGPTEQALERASRRDQSSRQVTDLALAELARAADDPRPFFLFAHYFDPHHDYVPPEPFARAFDPDYAGEIDGRDFIANPAIARRDETSASGWQRVVSERDLEHLEALYAGEIAWTDAEVGRLLDGLERLGLAANTLVVVVGDHGDEFFEHGGIGHRRTLLGEVVRVPMLLCLPGVLPENERRPGPHGLEEIQREILGLVGTTPPTRARPGTAPLGRVVRCEDVQLTATTLNRNFSPGAILVRVSESYQAGRIKILRERSFLRATDALPPWALDVFAQLSQERFARESLLWIDLDRHPDEEGDAWSEDFSQVPARSALLAFRDDYEALLRQRRRAPLASESAELLAALRGLGYVGQEARIGTLDQDDLVLPLPGEHVLGPNAGR